MTVRKYTAIWSALKQKGKCTVEVHTAILSRVKRGVSKEKDQDLAFKVLNDHDYFYIKTVVDKTATKNLCRVTFYLKQRLGLEGIK